MKGLSLHIGLNSIDPTHYGTSGLLRGCENDARDMKAVADSLGYQSSIVLTKEATANRILTELASASAKLQSGDVFFISYSGHGAQIPDKTNDEDDGQDETWCLYDRMLLDDELYTAWSRMKPGVRVIVLSDSCHSGTVVKQLNVNGQFLDIYPDDFVKRCLDPQVAYDVFDRYEYLYTNIKRAIPSEVNANLGCSVLLISGCQDNQLSSDGVKNGLFTEKLLQVWNKGNFKGTYRAFSQQIEKTMNAPLQSPNYFFIGAPNADFEMQKPFSITPSRSMGPGGLGEINEADRRITYKIDVDGQLLAGLSEDQLQGFFQDAVPFMVEGYKKFRTVSSTVYSTTRGGEVHGEVHCDSHGNCGGSIGGSIRW